MAHKTKTKESIIFAISRLPPSLNVLLHMHWVARNQLQKTIEDHVCVEWLKVNRLIFTKPVKITYFLSFPKKRIRDFDNYLGGTKLITDALKKTFLFRDDSGWVKGIEVRFMTGVEGTVINIAEEGT